MNVLSRFEGRPTDILNRIPSTTGQGKGILDSLGGQNGAAPAASQPQPANNSGVPNSGAVAPQSQTTTQPAPATTTQQAPAATGQQTAPATTTPAQSGNGVPTGN